MAAMKNPITVICAICGAAVVCYSSNRRYCEQCAKQENLAYRREYKKRQRGCVGSGYRRQENARRQQQHERGCGMSLDAIKYLVELGIPLDGAQRIAYEQHIAGGMQPLAAEECAA